ncbi:MULTISPECIES: hypothetical protein [unclassified Bacteroides]|jgi:hypothetical protein|uniref:hypothetical protein n=1 Tax=unclassified Bacteroides TaxID=2646097 RepID=UPI001F394163|nr:MULTISPECIES: hypothetical protein [unclassified Bacteroides]
MIKNTNFSRIKFSYLLLGSFLLSFSAPVASQMKEPHEWLGYEKVMGVKNGLMHYDYDVKTISSTAPANVFWPEDKLLFTFQLQNNLEELIDVDGHIEVIHYGTRGIPNDIWLPEIFSMGNVETIPVKLKIAPNGYTNLEITPSMPSEFGGYAIVFDLGKYGRRLGTSFVKSMKPTSRKLQFPKQSLDDLGVDFLTRVGVQAIRYGLPYCPTTFRDYQSIMRKFDEDMKRFKDNNITVLLMFGEGQALNPLGTPRSFLDDNNVFLRSKQDYAWLPELDNDFEEFVKSICMRHGWPDGPVTAVSLWNEPWEGISISGWQSDMLRYREIYKAMAAGVLESRELGKDILIGGGDSNSNAWDKFFSDGTMDMLPIFDFLSIHYQGMESPVLYPEWNQRKDYKGRVLIWDTESWVGNTDDRIGLVVAANRSAGYDRSMGIYGGYMYGGDPHNTEPNTQIKTESGVEMIPSVHPTWSSAAAMGAVQGLIGEREFRELLFKNGLPWIMVFDGYENNPDDGTVVITGDLGEAFGAENVLFRDVRGLNEINEKIALREKLDLLPADSPERIKIEKKLRTYKGLVGGKLTLKAHPSFLLYDFYGNVIKPKQGVYEIPLTFNGYYLRTNGTKDSFKKLLDSLRKAYIEGYEPLDIIAKDMVSPLTGETEMELVLTNILNRSVGGNLKITLGDLLLSYPQKITFKAHETKTVKVKISGKASPDNLYPLSVKFDAGKDGIAAHWEDMHVNYIEKRTITVDGKLDDWEGALPQVVKSSDGASLSVTEAAWYPFKEFEKSVQGMCTAYLAYDDTYFYFAAKAADQTPDAGTCRFETRDDDDFFYPEVSYMQTKEAMHTVERINVVDNSNQSALQYPDSPICMMNYWENTSTTHSIGLDLNLPYDRFIQTALYLPDWGQSNLIIVISEQETGKELLRQHVSSVWNGVYLLFNLSGKLRVRITTEGWWYTAKLSGIFFDESGTNIQNKTSAYFIKKDFDTKGNWKSVYGKAGYHLVGILPRLPENISLNIVDKDDLLELKWPEGVRRYTYRKDPILPDASMAAPTDNILIAFNVLQIGEDGMESYPKGTMPKYVGYKCTDYEYALNTVAPEYGGGFEIWRMLVPGMPRKHFYPRQPKSPYDGPVKDGKLVTLRDGNTLYTECAIPWTEIPDVKKAIDRGEKIKFSYRVNDNGNWGACMELARNRSVSKRNSRAFHPDWREHWANEVEFGVEK